MKKKIDKKTITLIIIACALAVSTLIISMIAASSNKKPVGDQTLGPDTTPSSEGTIVIHDPGAAVTQKPDSGGGEASPDEGSDKELVLVLEDPSNTSTPSSAGEVAPIGAVPVSGQIPGDDGPGGSSSGHGHTGEYHCGTPGHTCDSPETHAHLLNLEKDGCPYCGRHDCPSFRAVDEWGTAVYDPTCCPKYDVHLDPVYYCQVCHKPCGDGAGGSCVRFVNACHCPLCGKWVEAWTCHSCGR